MVLFGGTMNKKIKDILVIIGLVIGAFSSIAGGINVTRDDFAYAIVYLNLILYSLCLIIVGTSRET
ncbi:MAG: hypothetical protein Q7J35_06295 [Candidatus Methanoperedens sp.]|nr:hypothetical protein [Candidatus Methanoperedens sp.]